MNAEEIEALLDEHASVNSTAGWAGSPNPADWRNIRRVCKCGEVIGWPKGYGRGRPFDPPHRAHIAEVLAR